MDKILECVKSELREKAHDFAIKVAPVYQLLDWKWWVPPSPCVPTTEQIYQTILYLIDTLDQPGTVSTGGLVVGFKCHPDEGVNYFLKMSIKECVYGCPC